MYVMNCDTKKLLLNFKSGYIALICRAAAMLYYPVSLLDGSRLLMSFMANFKLHWEVQQELWVPSAVPHGDFSWSLLTLPLWHISLLNISFHLVNFVSQSVILLPNSLSLCFGDSKRFFQSFAVFVFLLQSPDFMLYSWVLLPYFLCVMFDFFYVFCKMFLVLSVNDSCLCKENTLSTCVGETGAVQWKCSLNDCHETVGAWRMAELVMFGIKLI